MKILPVVVALFLIQGCAPNRLVATYMKRDVRFQGPRAVLIRGASAPLLAKFEAVLIRDGFRVHREVPGVSTTLPSRYVVDVHARDIDRCESALDVEGFDAIKSERVFAAHTDRDEPCPSLDAPATPKPAALKI